MNILLMGGAGYIGSHAAMVLIEAGHRVQGSAVAAAGCGGGFDSRCLR